MTSPQMHAGVSNASISSSNEHSGVNSAGKTIEELCAHAKEARDLLEACCAYANAADGLFQSYAEHAAVILTYQPCTLFTYADKFLDIMSQSRGRIENRIAKVMDHSSITPVARDLRSDFAGTEDIEAAVVEGLPIDVAMKRLADEAVSNIAQEARLAHGNVAIALQLFKEADKQYRALVEPDVSAEASSSNAHDDQ